MELPGCGEVELPGGGLSRGGYLVVGEAGVVRSSEGGETVHLEGADGVTAARGELLADGVDAIFIYVRMDGVSAAVSSGWAL